jgi:hypothetical protein
LGCSCYLYFACYWHALLAARFQVHHLLFFDTKFTELGGFSNFLRQIDFLYSTNHATPTGGNVVNQKQITGGFFSLAAFATILVLVISSLVQYATSNTITRSTIVPGVSSDQTLNDVYITLHINSKIDCRDAVISTEAVGFPTPQPLFVPVELANGACELIWYCAQDCKFQFGKEV